MDVTTFQCPHCQAVLRMRRKQLTDTTFSCPDCDHPLQISQTTEGQLSISAITASPIRKDRPQLRQRARALGNALHRYGTFLITSPVLMSWLVAGIGAFLILLVILLDQRSPSKSSKHETVTNITEASKTASKESVNTELPEFNKAESAPPALAEAKQNTQSKPEIPAQPEPINQDAPNVPEESQELIAAKPEHIPPLNAQKPQLAQPLPVLETDVNAALLIPIIEFRQPKDIPLKQLIRQLEEMLGSEFQFAENVKNDKRLMETPVSLSLKNTTLSDLLKQVLGEVALTFSVKSNKIHIQKAEASIKSDQSALK